MAKPNPKKQIQEEAEGLAGAAGDVTPTAQEERQAAQDVNLADFNMTGGKTKPGETPSVPAQSFFKEGQKLLGTAQQAPSVQQDITQVLSSYMDQLTNLGPEYGAEMEYLKPYLQPDASALGTPPAYTGPGADVVNKTTADLQAAEQGTAKAYENMSTPGFGSAADLVKQYEATLPYQQPIQAQLGYEKYLQTYGGLAPNTVGVPQDIQNLYKAIGGSAGSSSGLPTPGQAAAAGNANQLLNTAGNQSTPTPGQ